MLNRRDAPENLWIKCPVTGEMVFHRDLENNQFVVPNSDYHMRLNATQRFGFLFDDGDYTLIDLPEAAMDPLKFRDTKRYTDRMRDARAKTGKQDSISVAQGNLEGLRNHCCGAGFYLPWRVFGHGRRGSIDHGHFARG